MLSGIGLVSTVTGSISSIFTTRKIMEGRGLSMIESNDHIVVCGWNENVEHLLACMSQITTQTNKDIILINDLSEYGPYNIQSSSSGKPPRLTSISSDQSELLVSNP